MHAMHILYRYTLSLLPPSGKTFYIRLPPTTPSHVCMSRVWVPRVEPETRFAGWRVVLAVYINAIF